MEVLLRGKKSLQRPQARIWNEKSRRMSSELRMALQLKSRQWRESREEETMQAMDMMKMATDQ